MVFFVIYKLDRIDKTAFFEMHVCKGDGGLSVQEGVSPMLYMLA